MAASVSMRIRWDPAAIRGLRTDPQVTAAVHEVAEDLERAMLARTPRNTGAAAASIGITTPRAAGALNVGWDAAHFYLIFPEYGTKFISAQRFARDTLDAYQFM